MKRIEGIHYQTGEVIALLIGDGRIVEIQSTCDKKRDGLPWIGPGLVDLQINGFRGYDFNTFPISPEDVLLVTYELWKEGLTTYLPTIITNSDERIEQALGVINAACLMNKDVEKTIKGVHLEGPFISPEDGPRGAHNQAYVKAPDWRLFQRWQEASGGRIKIITISPEWEGSNEFITKCVASGVTVSIGHTAATPKQIRSAVAAGARMSTHLGNGAHLMLPRHPNYIWEQLSEDSLSPCLIADGFHLPASFLKVVFKIKGHNSMLVSDAVSLSGMPPGEYHLHIGGKVILKPEGRLHLADNPDLLAGSAQMLTHGIEFLYKNGICDFAEAWEMASIRPSIFMDFSTKEGINVGEPADLVVFQRDENRVIIEQTYKNGKLVYSTSDL
jgi:N-acetylglucosamine-6-phosphate deacetylase